MDQHQCVRGHVTLGFIDGGRGSMKQLVSKVTNLLGIKAKGRT